MASWLSVCRAPHPGCTDQSVACQDKRREAASTASEFCCEAPDGFVEALESNAAMLVGHVGSKGQSVNHAK